MYNKRWYVSMILQIQAVKRFIYVHILLWDHTVKLKQESIILITTSKISITFRTRPRKSFRYVASYESNWLQPIGF